MSTHRPPDGGADNAIEGTMPRDQAAVPTYDPYQLREFSVAVLETNGVSGEHAAVAAERMLEADMRGVPSHGIFRLPSYVRRLRAGGYNLTPDIRTLRESQVSALVDGDNALGQVVVSYAADVAIAKAKRNGMAWVGIRHSNHAGAGGVYASLALQHDLIGIYAAVGNANHMAPWGGVEPLLSTNPIAIAIPAGKQPPFVLDMATTVVSFGKLKIARQRGITLPENWVIDRDGNPVTNPEDAVNGLLLPIGGYKGYGLNLAIGLIAGTLTGASFGSETIDFNHDFKTPTNTGQFLIMISPELFRPFSEFAESVDARIAEFRSSRPIRAGQPVRTPGDQLARRAARARERGIELGAETVESLTVVGAECGVEFPSPARRTGSPSHDEGRTVSTHAAGGEDFTPEPSLILRPAGIAPVDRGSGAVTIPFVGKWNSAINRVTTGITRFDVGVGIPMHTHNVEETVLIVEGSATAIIGGQPFALEAGEATWVPADVPHCFQNRGESRMTIYWVYGGREVTRTIVATGQTFEHLSAADRGTTQM